MTNTFPQPNDSVCLRQFSDGRRCRMLRKLGHASLCPFHANEERKLQGDDQKLLEQDRLASELATLGAGGALYPDDIARVTAKLFNALASNRISPRSAATLGYLAQLLLQSLGKRRPTPQPQARPRHSRWRPT
jgi:hypothetical protein